MKKFIVIWMSIVISLAFCSCKKLPSETHSVLASEILISEDTSSAILSSEVLLTSDSSDIDQSSNNSSTILSPHIHTYIKQEIKPTCTEDGYTKYSCDCGVSYKDNFTSPLGHSYSKWSTIKEATTSSTGTKECVCSQCGNRLAEELPKLTAINGVDAAVKITTGGWDYPKYVLGKCSVLDTRTWGETPTITVYNENCMHVTYFNKNNEKIEFNVEPPGIENYLYQFTLLEDGTYVSQLYGSYS